MDKVYARINWENTPSTKTPLGALNLNKTDYAINALDDRVIKHDTEKADKTQLLNLVSNWTMDENTGIITVTKVNGEKILFDLNIEKIPVSFALSPDGILTMTTADGTKFTANIGAMIPILTFNSTDTIAVNVTGTGINKTYSFEVKNGSITEDKLRPDYLADIKTQTAAASASAIAAADSAKAAKDSETNSAESEASAASSAADAQAAADAAAASETVAELAKESATQSAQDALASKVAAEESANAAEASEANAAQSEKNASNSEKNASDKAKESADSALLSESWAHGQTGVRDGEDTNNSEFYSNQSKDNYKKAEQAGIDAVQNIEKAETEALESINNALGSEKVEFYYDPVNAHLYYTADTISFNVALGHLMIGVNRS